LLNLDTIIMEERRILSLRPIGIIHSPYHYGMQAPYQGAGHEETCQVELFKEFEEGLKDIEGFSHIILIYYLHKSQGHHLLVRTPWDIKPHGLFTTRSPNRPNPLGLSVVELIDRKGNILEVKGLDAIDGTPLLDIKPYIATGAKKSDIKVGWLEKKRG
jgi:tRNA-Thr(GGU) m(6)t(6)A37 methyltransferase TsaA